MTNDVSPPSVMANTTSRAATPRSPICFLPNAVKSSNPSTALMRAKSPPAMTLKARSSHSAAGGAHARPRARWRCQKSRQIDTSWMLSRPVEPQPVKKILPPRLSRPATSTAMPAARPDSTNVRNARTTSSSTSKSRRNAAAVSRAAVSLRLTVTGWDPSVISAPSLNWPEIRRKSSDLAWEVWLITERRSAG
jgi:hypothetical protein